MTDNIKIDGKTVTGNSKILSYLWLSFLGNL